MTESGRERGRKPIRCRLGLHGPYGGVKRRQWPYHRWWCLGCGTTWDRAYTIRQRGRKMHRRFLSYGERND